MEWLTSIRTASDYMEEHLTDGIGAQDAADQQKTDFPESLT